jgi:hypothetical protein
MAVAVFALLGLATGCGSGTRADRGVAKPAETKPVVSRVTPVSAVTAPKASDYAHIPASPAETTEATPVPDPAYEPLREPTDAETQAAIDAKITDQIAEACASDSNNAMCDSMMP